MGGVPFASSVLSSFKSLAQQEQGAESGPWGTLACTGPRSHAWMSDSMHTDTRTLYPALLRIPCMKSLKPFSQEQQQEKEITCERRCAYDSSLQLV